MHININAATSLTGGQPNFARCLAVSWTATLYIHFRGLLPPDGVQSSLYVQVLRNSPTLAALLHGTPAASVSQTSRVVQGMDLYNSYRGRQLYAAWRPSRWALAHILVLSFYSAPQCSHCKRCTSYNNSVCLSVRLAVRLSVCHMPVLCQNDGT